MRKAYDGLILFLSVYVLIQLSLEVILTLSPKMQVVLSWIDFGICVVFIGDWFTFLGLADSKRRYAKTRWVDLLASIPFAQVLRPLRVLRVVRAVRMLRLTRGMKGALPLIRVLTANPARSAMTVYLTITTVVYFYCTVGLYNFEKGINDSIASFGDSLWMAFTTLTSVGYGDIYPVTGGGRIMAVILVITGMGLFSLVTAEFATLILNATRNQKSTKAVD